MARGRELTSAASIFRRRARNVVLLAASVIAAEYAAVHVLAGAPQAWRSAWGASPTLLVVALVLELGSFGCYSGITRAVLPDRTRPAYPTVLAVDLSGNGLSHVVPGGGATAAAFRFRLLGRVGVPAADTLGATAMESAITALWLVMAFVIGLLAAVPNPATHPFLRTTAVLAVVTVTMFGGLVAVLMARPDQVVTVTHALAGRVPLLRPEALERLVGTVISQVGLLLRSPIRRRRTLLWGLGYWLLDAACLYLCVLAFGVAANPGGLLTTYALVSLLALLPLTPGGLGLVEGVAVPALVSFGVPHEAALLGVLTWRLLEFWLPIPIGLATYVWLRSTRLRRQRQSTADHVSGVPRTPGRP